MMKTSNFITERTVQLSLLLILSLGAPLPVSSLSKYDSIRCSGALIRPGDLRIKVLEKCGEPDDRVEYNTYTITHTRYYRSIELRKKQLVDHYVVEYDNTDDYVADRLELESKKHSHRHFVDPYYNNRARMSRRGSVQHKIIDYDLQELIKAEESIWECSFNQEKFDNWFYNLGPQQFIRIITFKGGRVYDIETGDYGF